MGIFQNAIKTIELLATSIALISLSDMEDINYIAKNLSNHDQCGLTQDFIQFINNNGYSSFDFNRTDVKCGSFGGKASSKEEITQIPIIFIHGISDIAFGRGSNDGYLSWQTGFRSLMTYLIQHGMNKNSLYTTTWGSIDHNEAQKSYLSKKNVLYLRNFIEAVIKYTKAKEIIIIGHSMGVSLARKAIKGGSAKDHKDGVYEVGQSLGLKVKAFIGIAGGNLGLTSCYNSQDQQTCNKIDGFNPGDLPQSGPSAFLQELNTNKSSQGNKIYTIWSKYDDLIGYECLVWGQVTCRISYQHAQIIKETSEWGHFNLRDDIGPDILKILNQK